MTKSLPDWIPPNGHDVRQLPAGRWFDAVEVHSFTAAHVLGRLGRPSGPAVEDQAQDVVRWLLPPRAAAGWTLPGTRVLGHGDVVAIPPAEWTWSPRLGAPPVRWLYPPTETCLTDPGMLHEALTATLLPPPRAGHTATTARPEDAITVVTGREGPLDPTVAATCSYLPPRHRGERRPRHHLPVETREGADAVTVGITLRWGSHELMGQLVTDPTTGRVGRLDGVLEHVSRGTGRVLRVEAHMRPVDGSGVEWTADANALVSMTDSS